MAVILVIMLLIGCGPRGIRYTATLSDLKCSAKSTVAIAVLDQRPYVLKKEKESNYVGLVRGGYGNPFDIWTESGSPLADDMLKTIADSLRSRGFSVTPLKTSVGETPSAVLTRFGAAKADRLLLLVLREWYSDYLPEAFAQERSNLFISVEVQVFGRNQKQLAKTAFKEDLILPSGWPEETVPDVYQRKIRQLIDDARICRALQ